MESRELMTDAPRSLADDQRGAIMLTGLFMSCFLIGALWFIVGIGDAIVFRDKMQEAADVGAFSSAALHAKGMNFISLCNLVMLVGTIIHLVLGIISDAKLAQAIYICIQTVGIGCIPAVADYEAAYRRWDSYFNIMSKGFKAIHIAQKTASYAYPAMGVVEAYQNGSKYGGDARTSKVNVLALSSSILPGAAARGLGNAVGGRGQALGSSVTKEGLPVEAKPFSDLCKKVVSVTTTGAINLLGVGKSMGAVSQGALSIFNSIVGSILEIRYCNKTDMHFEPLGPGWDSFWGEDGPYIVYGAAQNGNVWMQTWAVNMNPKLTDSSESRVGFAGGPKKASKYTKQEGALGYFAQAEMYVDCDAKWSDTVCNFEDQATYTIKWRARLRRLELPAITSGAVGAAMEGFLNLPNIAGFKDALGGKIGDILGATGLGRGALKGLVDGLVKQVAMFALGQVGGVADGLNPTLSGFGLNSPH
jgi:hypothetical protein